jgi:hypothetical protein
VSPLQLATVLSVAFFAAPAVADDVPVSEAASRRFSEGVRYLRSDAPDRFQKAYREFRAAYDDSPSWKILGNLGIVAHEIERDGEAIEAYEKYLEGGGSTLDNEERAQFERDLSLLRSRHSTVSLTVEPTAAWIIDERLPEAGDPIVNRYGPSSGPLVLKIRAGHHRIRAERDGYVGQGWEFAAEAGETAQHTFELSSETAAAPPAEPQASALAASLRDQPPGDSNGARVGAYVALGIGVAAAGAGGWFLYDTGQKEVVATDRFRECALLTPPTHPEAGNCLESSGRAYDAAQTAADEEGLARALSLVSFGVAGAALVTSAVLFWASSDSQDTDTALVPFIGPGSVGVSGRF